MYHIEEKESSSVFTIFHNFQQLQKVNVHKKKLIIYNQVPINLGLATPFLSYSERSQNAEFHLAIVQTRPSPPMVGFVDKVLARFNCAIFNLLCLYNH